ncbi:alpha/beta-hydrolase lipase region domain-containing protein [Phthorimaea operculella]|nr:alpha/beta-hydrolase lipase region domain-containing protein [Phthorimaea operculella]
MLCKWCVFGAFCLVVAAAPSYDATATRNGMLNIILNNGYVAEPHNVTTEDGYILGVYRIPYPRHQTSAAEQNRPVVFCMHGLYGQSQNYLMLPPEVAFGFNLADAGFDVWFGNARGNVHSRNHVTLNPDSPLQSGQFFNFSWDEIGIYDLPAMIDYILAYTGQEKLHYIGHSQGGTTFFVLGSVRPEYNEKLASVHLLAGVGYMEYFPNTQLASIAQLSDEIYSLANLLGLSEFTPDLVEGLLGGGGGLPLPEGVRRSDLCFGDIKYRHMCELVGARHFMRDVDNNTEQAFGGGSLKQIAHYGQNIRDKIFKRFDYGPTENVAIYGSETAPEYDLSLITSNVVMHYTVADDLLDERDVLAMAEVMPNTVVRKVARETFGHGDFVAALDAKELVTDFIIESIINVHNGVSDKDSESSDVTDPESPETPVNPDQPSGASVSFLSVLLRTYLMFCTAYLLL